MYSIEKKDLILMLLKVNMMLYGIMCMSIIQKVNPDANPDFDMQTFDNLFQAITMAKETYL